MRPIWAQKQSLVLFPPCGGMSGTTLSLSALSRQGTRWLPALLGFQYVAVGNTKEAGRAAAVDTKALGVWGWLQKRKVCPAAKPQYHPLECYKRSLRSRWAGRRNSPFHRLSEQQPEFVCCHQSTAGNAARTEVRQGESSQTHFVCSVCGTIPRGCLSRHF